jgi:hypothetical protein
MAVSESECVKPELIDPLKMKTGFGFFFNGMKTRGIENKSQNTQNE